MRIFKILLFTSLFAYTHANAFFFFIPGSTVQAIKDSVTGGKGNICVKKEAKVGDVQPSIAGNTLTIISLSGTDSICQNPATPIRAEVQYALNYSSKAVIKLTDGYQPRDLTDFEKYHGNLIIATYRLQKNKGVTIYGRVKTPASDPQALADILEKNQTNSLVGATTKNAEKIKINGFDAWRFEVHGKTKGVFGSEVFYLITVIESPDEILVINAYSSEDSYDRDILAMKDISQDIKWLNASNQNKNDASKVNSGDPPEIITRVNLLMRQYKDGVITQKEYEERKEELLKNQ